MTNAYTATWSDTLSLTMSREDGANRHDDSDIDIVTMMNPQRVTLRPSLNWLHSCMEAARSDAIENEAMGDNQPGVEAATNGNWRLDGRPNNLFCWSLVGTDDEVYATLVIRTMPLDE